MASIATVVTMGFGSFGSANLLPTIGYGIGAVSTPTGPFDGWASPRQLLDYTTDDLIADWTSPQLLNDWSTP